MVTASVGERQILGYKVSRQRARCEIARCIPGLIDQNTNFSPNWI